MITVPTRVKHIESLLNSSEYGQRLLFDCVKAMRLAKAKGHKSVQFSFDTRSLVTPAEANMNEAFLQLLRIRQYRITKQTPASVTFTWLDANK